MDIQEWGIRFQVCLVVGFNTSGITMV